MRLSNVMCAALAAAVFCSFSFQASAQQRPVSWTGSHVGISLGGVRSALDIDYAATPMTPGGFTALGAASIIAGGTGTINRTGVIAGGQIGYDRQWGHFVGGGEFDFSYTDLSGTRTATVFNVPDSLRESFSSRFLSTVRGRVGYAQDAFLVYATGGLALADLKVNDFATNVAAGTAQSSSHSLRAGWTLGGGAEWMVAPRWSVKAEYLYADLGTLTDQHVFSNFPRAVSTHDHQLTENIVRFGVNYRFN